jgi:hypothetical protein
MKYILELSSDQRMTLITALNSEINSHARLGQGFKQRDDPMTAYVHFRCMEAANKLLNKVTDLLPVPSVPRPYPEPPVPDKYARRPEMVREYAVVVLGEDATQEHSWSFVTWERAKDCYARKLRSRKSKAVDIVEEWYDTHSSDAEPEEWNYIRQWNSKKETGNAHNSAK